MLPHFRSLLSLLALTSATLADAIAVEAPLRPSREVASLIENHCADCHDDVTQEAGLDLLSLVEQPVTSSALVRWRRVYERLEAGEMPPKTRKQRPQPKEVDAFLADLGGTLHAVERQLYAEGRSTKRRLNRYEYENTLRDLLSRPYLAVKDGLPEDPTAHGYNKVGEALDVSHVQLARYLRVAETALRDAIAPSVNAPVRQQARYHTWLQRGFVKNEGPALRRTFPIVEHELQMDLLGYWDPVADRNLRAPVAPASREERRDSEAMVMLMSTYEPAEIQFNEFRAPVAGYYRLRFSGYTVWMSPDYTAITPGRRTEPVVIYAQSPPWSLRRVAAFDWGPEPSVRELEVWLNAGETLQPDAARLVRSRPPDFENPLLEPDGMPGVAFQWMDVDGPLPQGWPEAGHQLLFDDLPLHEPAPGSGVAHVEVRPNRAEADADRLLRRFAQRAYRRPVPEAEIQRFLSVIGQALETGHSFTDAMIAGYTAVLISPGFIYLQSPEQPQLDDWAVAERLSYFLWNSAPDEPLRTLAATGRLRDPGVLHAEVERLLDDPRSRRFVNAFLDYWLDLRKINSTTPDAELYPEYQLDDLLNESLLEESQLFAVEMLRRNLPARTIVASDFAVLNERLATLYGVPDVSGVHLRPVPLPADSVRGGLITQGSVLKITANGTTTSPVTRGVWVLERILGIHTPPPPAAVQAIESDIRGATTIREQLALHRTEKSCNSCHRKIDPPGFALESFDVMGGWRTRYRASHQGQGEPVPGIGRDGQLYRYLLGPDVDASGQLPDARTFADIREFRQALLTDEEAIARNLVQQLTVYATGAPVRFSDRAALQDILSRTRPSGHGLRSLIHALVQSELFLQR